MNTRFSANVNGVKTDLINIFQPYYGTKLIYNTGFYSTSYGTDLTNVFEAYNSGDPSANNTKFIIYSNRLDLSQVFAKIPILPSFPTISSGYTSTDNVVMMAIYGARAICGGSASSQIYKSNNYGQTYTPTSSLKAWRGFAIFGKYAVACSTDSIFVSSDSGDNWTQSSGMTNSYAGCAIRDNLAAVADTTTNRLYVSNNYGATWVSCTSAATLAKTWRQPSITKLTNGTYIAALTSFPSTGVYYCTNFTGSASDTFTVSASSVPGALIPSLFGSNGIVCSYNSGSTANVLYYTRDGGVTWTNSGFNGPSQLCTYCELSGQIGVACFFGVNSYYVTKNAGSTWTSTSAPQGISSQITAISCNNGNALMYDNLSASKQTYYGKLP